MSAELQDMIRTMPEARYGCATCGEFYRAYQLHWHPHVTGQIDEGWHCHICEPRTAVANRVALDQVQSAAGRRG